MTATAPWVDQLCNAPLSERRSLLEGEVVRTFKSWLQMTDDDPIGLDESYFSLGLSSLGAVEVQHHLEARLGRRIDTANLYNNPTIAHLVSYLCDEVLPEIFVPSHRETRTTDSAHHPVDPTSRQLLDDLLTDLYDAG